VEAHYIFHASTIWVRPLYTEIGLKKTQKADFAMKQTNICRLSGDIITYKRRYACLSVCLLPMAGRTAGPIKTKLGIGTHVDPGSVLGKVKLKVMWRHLANANKTPYRGPQAPTEFEREAR